jgi:hypothetical protein
MRQPRPRRVVIPEDVADALLESTLAAGRTRDPLESALFSDAEGLGERLADIVDKLRDFDEADIKGMLYRKPDSGMGGFQWIEDLSPPFDMSAIRSYLKGSVGGGAYRLSLFAKGRIRANFEFSIMGDRKTDKPAANANGDILAIMITQQAEDRRLQAENARRAEERYERERDRRAEFQGQLILAAIAAAPAIIPLLNNREKLADIIGLMNANKPDKTDLKETFEIITLAKNLTGGDSDKFDASDIAGSIARLAGPALAGLAKAMPGRRPPEEAAEYEEEPQELYTPPPPATLAAPAAGAPAAAPQRQSEFPAINMIKPHVVYFFHSQQDPGLAAEAIDAIIRRERVPKEDIDALVAAFSLAGDGWLELLAGEGIDLRSDPQWAGEFIQDLIERQSDDLVDHGTGPGGAGRMADADRDAEPGAPGQNVDGDPGAGD